MNKFPARPALCALLLILVAAIQSGCAGYRVGSMLPGDVKTVYVPTVQNKSSEPLIEIEITQSIIRQIQFDGSLQIVPESEADAILTVALSEYRLVPVAYRDDNRTAANQYRIILTANMVLRRTSDQSVVAESPRVTGNAVFDVTGDLSSSKLAGNPQAASDLADNIVQKIVEYW